jgi:hypothetical protein
MNYKRLLRASRVIALSSILLNIVGCPTVARENIISSIETGTGISIKENPTTQLYEIRAGLIRSQFYSIPTGKVVKTEDGQEHQPSDGKTLMNEADKTPQVISSIHIKSDVEHLILGTEVSESFVVGKEAVNSPAAIAMFSTSKDKSEMDSQTTQSLANAVKTDADATKATAEAEAKKITAEADKTKAETGLLEAKKNKLDNTQ